MSWSLSGNTITQANEASQSFSGTNDASPGVSFVVDAHGYSVGDLIQISGTSDYDGLHIVSAVTASTFTVEDLDYISSQGGTVARGDGISQV